MEIDENEVRTGMPNPPFVPTSKSSIDGFAGGVPGVYTLLIRADKTLIDPGDKLRLTVTVTGYGRFSGTCKIAWAFPENLIDSDNSAAIDRFRQLNDVGGYEPTKIGPDGSIMTISGGALNVDMNGKAIWPAPAVVYDVLVPAPVGSHEFQSVRVVSTEREPLLILELQTNKKSLAGGHRIDFVLTYHDGEEWKVSASSIDLQVRTWLQRQDNWIWWLGVPVLIVGFLKAIIDVVNYAIHLV